MISYMIKRSETTKSLPWSKLTSESIRLLKANPLASGIFGLLFLLSAIPSFSDFEEPQKFTPFQFWLYGTLALIWLFLSYFNSVVFIFWVVGKESKKDRHSLKEMLLSSMNLLIPLSVLSIRGTIVTGLCLFLLVIPGLYAAFKYQLASLCLIVEGWKDDAPPLNRAEEIIREYQFNLIPLALLLFASWIFPFCFDWLIGSGSFFHPWVTRLLSAIFESSLTFFTTIYFTLATLTLLRDLKKTS